MANDPAPRPPEKVLNDKEYPESKITTPPTSNFMNNNNNEKKTKEMITLAKRKNKKAKISKLTF